MLCCYCYFCWVSTCLFGYLWNKKGLTFLKSNINFIFQSDCINNHLYYLYLFLSVLYLKVSVSKTGCCFKKCGGGGKEGSGVRWHFLVCILPLFFNLKSSKYCSISYFNFIFNTCSSTLAVCSIFCIRKDLPL